MALKQSLEKSFDKADRMVDLARAANYHKAAGGRSIDSLVSQGPMGDGKKRVNYGQAVEQYRSNKGWVYSCIRAVAQRIAGQPIRVASVPKRTTRDVILKAVASLTSTATAKDYTGLGGVDDLKPLDQHPLLDVLADPNPLQVAWSLMVSTVFSLELTGQSLWWITSDGEKRMLLPLPTHWIQSISAKRSSFTIRPEGMTETFPISGDDACLFAYPDPSNPFGALSPLQQIAEAVETDDSIQFSQRRAFKAGINQKLALVVGKMPMPNGVDRRPTLTQPQRRQLISAILAAHAGEGNEHSPIILDGMIERIDKLSIAPKEMDYIDSSKVVKGRITQGFGVNPILLGETEGANRASAYVADEIFCTNKVNPTLLLMSQAMTEWLGPAFAGDNERLVVWIEPAVARDSQVEMKVWDLLARFGICTINEMRQAFRLPTIPGGNQLVVQGGTGREASQRTKAANVSLLAKGVNPYTLKALTSGRVNGSGANGKASNGRF